MHKICTKCHIKKPLNQFKKTILKPDGRCTQCKLCYKKYLKEYNQKNKVKTSEIRRYYYIKNKEICLKRMQKHHKKCPWKRVFYNAKARCENPKSSKYKYYGGRGIKFLITQKEIKFLWIRDKAWLLKEPSIDRIDNDGNYELNNCRFIEQSENTIKSCNKPILQLSKQGKLIQKWDNITKASKKLNISPSLIGMCANEAKSRQSAGGFKWKFQ